MANSYINDLADDMQDIGEIIAHRMKDILYEGDSKPHVLTGNLLNSIRSETEVNGDHITTRVYADAVSDDGALYADFLEHGTGIYRDSGDGRQTPWKYPNPYEPFDENGNRKFITTHGQKPTHFIQRAIDGSDGTGSPIGELIQEVANKALKNFLASEITLELKSLKYNGVRSKVAVKHD